MDYVVDREALTAAIGEEVSRVAASEYSDGGVSLYDSIAISSRDSGAVSRLLDSALESVVSRLPDICGHVGAPSEKLVFSVPDLPDGLEASIGSVLGDYLLCNVCAAWLRQRAAERAGEYAERRDALLVSAVKMLKTRRRAAR